MGCNDEILKTLCSSECKFKKKSEATIDDLPYEDLISFIEREIPNPEALIENGILPVESQLIIGGSSKRGKSVLAANMALNLVTATPFLGQFAIPKARRGIVFQSEISEVSHQDRLQKMIKVMPVKPKPGYLTIVNKKGLNLNRQKDFDQICRVIENCQAEFGLIDPLYRFHSGDENKSEVMKAVFSRIDELTEKYKMAWAIIHHFGKPTEVEREGAQMLRGSSTIFDYGDSYLSLKRQSRNKPKEYITVTFELRNAEDPSPIHLWRNPDTLWYEVQGIDTQTLISDHDILTLVQNAGGSILRSELIEKVSEALKVSRNTAVTAIEHAKPFLVVKQLKTRGSPIQFSIKPGLLNLNDLVFNPIKPIGLNQGVGSKQNE